MLAGGSASVDQNMQFIITVGTVVGVFLWLRNDINRLDKEISSLRKDVTSLRGDVNSISADVTFLRNEVTTLHTDVTSISAETSSTRESLAWMRGRMGYSEPPTDTEE